ncbi:MAG: hypothetical protein HY748_16625 [Elusimicrobia bacterium]|nr:hypothetical protein [Elusimicrobiota bacterium]
MPAKMPATTAVDTTMLSVESPMPGERIKAKNCCFMFRAEVEGAVEASIDGGAWRRCRHLMGYWWLDWECKRTGPHRVVARIKTPEGAEFKSGPRRFQVI